MANYFRVTAYHAEQNISVILDSDGRFKSFGNSARFWSIKDSKL